MTNNFPPFGINDRTAHVVFYQVGEGEYKCSETFSEAARLIFGCKTFVSYLSPFEYEALRRAQLLDAGYKPYMNLYFDNKELQFKEDGTISNMPAPT